MATLIKNTHTLLNNKKYIEKSLTLQITIIGHYRIFLEVFFI